MNTILRDIEGGHLRKERFDFEVGDVVEVHYRIREVERDQADGRGGRKEPKVRERTQVFIGTVIAKKHGGIRETFTVRRIVGGEGVERIFPLHCPNLLEVKVRRRGKVRRAKLYYLRERTGKATRLKEKRPAATKKQATPVPAEGKGDGEAELGTEVAEVPSEKAENTV